MYVLPTSFPSSRLELGSSKYLAATLACGRSGEITPIYEDIGNIPLIPLNQICKHTFIGIGTEFYTHVVLDFVHRLERKGIILRFIIRKNVGGYTIIH